MEEELIVLNGLKVSSEQEKKLNKIVERNFKKNEWEEFPLDKKQSLMKVFLGLNDDAKIDSENTDTPKEEENTYSEDTDEVDRLKNEISEDYNTKDWSGFSEKKKRTLIKDYLSKRKEKKEEKNFAGSEDTEEEKIAEEPKKENTPNEENTSEEKPKPDEKSNSEEKPKKMSKKEEDEYKNDLEKKLVNNSSTITQADLDKYSVKIKEITSEIGKMFIGQDAIVEMVMIALICEAHLLLEGVPGLAKSVLIETLSRTIDGVTYKRIQFIPDMLPSDLIGGQIFNPKTNEFKIVKGPIFANLVLTDEINRAPPKVHAALMEAMAEHKISIDKEDFELDRPFLVMATQNPLENKGTYALPEAVLDRFMFKIDLDYPKREHEKIIIEANNTTRGETMNSLKRVLNKEEILDMQAKAKMVHLSDKIKDYILDIIEATRGMNKKIEGIKFVQYGGSPRATISLGIGAKAYALTQGRDYVLPDDVRRVAKSILRHRLALNFKGKAYNVSTDKIVDEILSKVSEI